MLKKFANYCNTKYCIAVGNCLDAIKLTLNSYIELGKIKKNDEVLIPSLCWSTSLWPIIQSGLKPVFVDIDTSTLNIDIDDLKKKINTNEHSWNFGPNKKNFSKVIDIIKFIKKLEHFNYIFLKTKKFKETEILKLNSNKAKKKLNWVSKWNLKIGRAHV